MSLQEKLSRMSQNLQETKAETERQAQEKELEPIRARIKDLEKEKNQIELVKGSLELKSSEKTGKGMREYSKYTSEQAKNETDRLNTLIDKNKEALQTMGIENKDQLVENEEFAEETEVISYKKAKKESADLEISDSALKEKLKTFGISVDEENFSYDFAEEALAEKLQLLDGELLQEKLKTPEGKNEAIENLSKNFENSIPQVSFSRDEKTGIQTFNIGYSDCKITILGEKTKFESWHMTKLLPGEITALEKTHGKDVVKEALLKAYGNKTELAFESFDIDTKNRDKALRKDLERSSPEKGAEANKSFREFQKLADNFRTTLKEKAEELKAKGVHFNPYYAEKYGGTYEDFAGIAQYKEDSQLIERIMCNPSAYPPRLNFDTLKEFTNKRIQQIKELTEDIKGLETEEDVNKFTGGVRFSGIEKAHQNILHTKFDEVKKSQSYANEQGGGLMQFKSYEEALNYFNKKAEERENVKGKMLQVLENFIDMDVKKRELRREIETQNFGRDINDMENEILRLERNKEEALALTRELAELEAELSKEQVVLSGNEIKVPSVGQQLERLRKDIEIEGQNLKNLKQKISSYESSKPKIFGKDKWEKDFASLKQEQKDLEEKIRKMNNEDYYTLSRKYTFRIPAKQYSDVESLVKEQKYTEGSLSEVLVNLKAQLNEMINRKPPTSVINLYKEYKDLEKKLF